MFTRLRSILSQVVARFVKPGLLPADRLGWIYTPALTKALQSQISEILKAMNAGVSLENALTGFDGRLYGERIVEYPYFADWLARSLPVASILDVGCVLNNPAAYPVLKQHCRHIWFCNPAAEAIVWDDIETYYAVSTLDDCFKQHPLRFSHITCLSTIEHIGYDNSQYGILCRNPETRPQDEILERSIGRLAGLLDLDGQLLISFPFGKRAVGRHRLTRRIAFQVFDAASVEKALGALSKDNYKSKLRVFAGGENGWCELAEFAECDCAYGQGFPGAGAVAMIEINRIRTAE